MRNLNTTFQKIGIILSCYIERERKSASDLYSSFACKIMEKITYV